MSARVNAACTFPLSTADHNCCGDATLFLAILVSVSRDWGSTTEGAGGFPGEGLSIGCKLCFTGVDLKGSYGESPVCVDRCVFPAGNAKEPRPASDTGAGTDPRA